MIKPFLLLTIGLVICGCTSGEKVALGGRSYAPVPQQHVAVLLDYPDREYDVIGMVAAHGAALASDQSVFNKLQKSAADLGADAVVVKATGRSLRGIVPAQAVSYGSFSGNTYIGGSVYTPPFATYGSDVSGLAIKYPK